MSSAKITLIGMFNWLQSENINMFDAFKNLPSDIDVDTLSNLILSEGGEFEPLYANPYMMKDQVQLFVFNHLRTFNKWIDALNIQYNPLENYDRQEEWTDDGATHRNGSGTRSEQGSNTESRSGSESNSHNEHATGTSSTESEQNAESSGRTDGGGTTTTTNNVSAYDSSTMSPHDESIADSTTGSMTSSAGKTTTEDSGSTSSNSYGSDSGTTREDGQSSHTINGRDTSTEDGTSISNHVGRVHGNIGVLTSQQMLESELNLARFNIYEQICDLFIDELLIAVYV